MAFMTNQITCQVQAAYAVADVIKAHLDQFIATLARPLPPQTAYDIWLALHETFINVVDHAYEQQGGPVWLTMRQRDDDLAVEIELRDNGRSFRQPSISCPDPHLLQEGGYGLFLVHQLMDETIYTRTDKGNCWKLIKYSSG